MLEGCCEWFAGSVKCHSECSASGGPRCVCYPANKHWSPEKRAETGKEERKGNEEERREGNKTFHFSGPHRKPPVLTVEHCEILCCCFSLVLGPKKTTLATKVSPKPTSGSCGSIWSFSLIAPD